MYASPTGLTVVDFNATWCGPCKAIAPRFDQLSERHPGVNFLKVDVDEQSGIAGTYSVRAMPTFLFFKNGSKVDEVVGADIGKVESLVQSLGKGSSASSFPSGGGRVLGSGRSVGSSSVGGGGGGGGAAAGAGVGGLSIPGFSNLSVMQQQYLMFAAFGLVFIYLYFNQGQK
ncbi:Cytoplasmic thioredoxin isoenzyme 2 [Irineochytrium annulatum]|nr:Cytoplasmic thioredoxin isoenzyme 2 [Irineochytrium annulatum]